MAGQCVRRTSLAIGHIRLGLPASIRVGEQRPRFNRPLYDFLQLQTPYHVYVNNRFSQRRETGSRST
jgi:hypothetical protein